jgi:tRNA-dihydrouridine synthase 3
MYMIESITQFHSRCRFMHDIPAYLAAKTQDIRMPKVSEISDTPPFASNSATSVNLHPEFSSVDLSTSCPVFTETGECRCVNSSFQI